MKYCTALYALVAPILLSGCNDDSLQNTPQPGENTIKYATTIFSELPSKSRGKNESRYASFSADKIDESGVYLLTAVENKIELPSKSDTVKSRGTIVDSNTFGTSGYDKMKVYAYAFNKDYDSYEDAYDNNHDVIQYINGANVTLSNKGGETTATAEKDYRWTQSRYKLTFFGLFPCGDNTSYTLPAYTISDGWPTITYTVPENIDDHQDIMYAMSDDYLGDGSTCDYTAELPMKHALTAVSVELSTGFDYRVITNVTFDGIDIYGGYSLGDDSGWDLTSTKTGARSASYDIADNVTNMQSDGNVFMMIPQTLGDDATLSITVYNTVTGHEKTFTASISGGEWEMGSTAHYKLSTTDEDVEYFFETQRSTIYYSWDNTAAGEGEATASDVNITISPYNDEYAYLRLRSYKVTTKVVNGSVQTTYAKLGWNASVTSGSDIAYISPTDETFAQQIAGDETSWTNWTYRVYPRFYNDNAGYTRKSEENEKLAANAAAKTLGSAASPLEMSTYYSNGDARENAKRNSANCYMINYPGYYEIPVVAGPSLYNNSNGTSMYQLGTSGTGAMGTLKNFADYNLTSNWINYYSTIDLVQGQWYYPKADGSSKKDTYIEWQDVDGLVNLTYDYTRKSGDEFYIRFYVSKDKFTQGNAVIAVKNQSDEILWSYHIWVTPYTKDDTFTVQSNPIGGGTASFLKVPLGYVADDVKCYDAREAEITFTQKESGKKATVKMVQEYHEFQARSANYYQWGRKDPFPGALVEETGKLSSALVYETTVGEKPLYSTDDITAVGVLSASGITGVSSGFRNPVTFYYGHRYPDYNYFDLWGCLVNSASSTDYPGSVDAGLSSRKTAYDPCPAGFKVPPIYAMPAITSDGNNKLGVTSYADVNTSSSVSDVEKNGYIDFYTNRMSGTSKSGSTFRLYALGSRYSLSGELSGVGNIGYYWACTRWVTNVSDAEKTRIFSLRFSSTAFYSSWCNTDTYGYCVLPMVGDI